MRLWLSKSSTETAKKALPKVFGQVGIGSTVLYEERKVSFETLASLNTSLYGFGSLHETGY